MADIDDSTQTPPGYWFGEIEGRLNERMRSALADLGLRRGGWRILHTLADGPATPEELAERLPHGGDRGYGRGYRRSDRGDRSGAGLRGREHGYGHGFRAGWRGPEPRDERPAGAPEAVGEYGEHGEHRHHDHHDGHHDHGDHPHDGHEAFERGYERGFDRGFAFGAARSHGFGGPFPAPYGGGHHPGGPYGTPFPGPYGRGHGFGHPFPGGHGFGGPAAYSFDDEPVGYTRGGPFPGGPFPGGYGFGPGRGGAPFGDDGRRQHGRQHQHPMDRDERRARRGAHRIHRILAEFVERGWVWFDGDRATLTDEGRAAHDSAFERVQAVRTELANGIPEADYATTLATLEKMARNLGWQPTGSTGAAHQEESADQEGSAGGEPSMDA